MSSSGEAGYFGRAASWLKGAEDLILIFSRAFSRLDAFCSATCADPSVRCASVRLASIMSLCALPPPSDAIPTFHAGGESRADEANTSSDSGEEVCSRVCNAARVSIFRAWP